MRYWKTAPAMGSLEETVALAAEEFEELRGFAYMSAVARGASIDSSSRDAQQAIDKLLKSVKEFFFPQKAVESDAQQQKDMDFLRSHVIVVDKDRLARQQGTVAPSGGVGPTVFNPEPRGRLLK
jgi:hypothetical protein